MWRLAFCSLSRRKLRFLLLSLSIVIGTAFVAAIFMLTASFYGVAKDKIEELQPPVIEMTAQPRFSDENEGFVISQEAETVSLPTQAYLTESDLKDVRNFPGVREVSPSVLPSELSVARLSKQGAVSGAKIHFSKPQSWPGLSIFPNNIDEGLAPQAGNQAAIEAGLADELGVKVGDSLNMVVNQETTSLEVSGIFKIHPLEFLLNDWRTTNLLLTPQFMRQLTGIPPDTWTQFGLHLEPTAETATIINALNERWPNLNIYQASQGTAELKENLDDLMIGLRFGATQFALLAVIVGGFVISNTFYIILSQRTKELALLRTIGATKGQVFRLVLREASLTGLFASILGIVAGVLLSLIALALLRAWQPELSTIGLVIDNWSIVIPLVVGVVTTIAASFIPAIKNSRRSPLAALTGTEKITAKPLLLRGIFGSIILAAGIACILYLISLIGGDSLTEGWLVYLPVILVVLSVLSILVGLAIVSPVLAKIFSKICGWLLRPFGGIVSSLANRNIQRQPRRTSAVANIMMLGLSLITLVTVMAASVNRSGKDIVNTFQPYDWSLQSHSSPLPSNLVKNIEGLREAQDLHRIWQTDYLAIKDLSDLSRHQETGLLGVEIEGLDDWQSLLGLDDQELKNLKQGQVIIPDYLANELGIGVGDEIGWSLATGQEKTYLVGGIDDSNNQGILVSGIIVSQDVYEETIGVSDPSTLSFNQVEGVDAESLENKLEVMITDYRQVELVGKHSAIKEIESFTRQTVIIAWSLLGLAIFVSVLGIFNTLILSVIERQREIGILRSIGLARRQAWSMITWEAIVMSLFGLFLGVVAGLIFAWLSVEAIQAAITQNDPDSLVTFSFDFPTKEIILYSLIILVAAVAMALWPAIKAARTNIIRAISQL